MTRELSFYSSLKKTQNGAPSTDTPKIFFLPALDVEKDLNRPDCLKNQISQAKGHNLFFLPIDYHNGQYGLVLATQEKIVILGQDSAKEPIQKILQDAGIQNAFTLNTTTQSIFFKDENALHNAAAKLLETPLKDSGKTTVSEKAPKTLAQILEQPEFDNTTSTLSATENPASFTKDERTKRPAQRIKTAPNGITIQQMTKAWETAASPIIKGFRDAMLDKLRAKKPSLASSLGLQEPQPEAAQTSATEDDKLSMSRCFDDNAKMALEDDGTLIVTVLYPLIQLYNQHTELLIQALGQFNAALQQKLSLTPEAILQLSTDIAQEYIASKEELDEKIIDEIERANTDTILSKIKESIIPKIEKLNGHFGSVATRLSTANSTSTKEDTQQDLRQTVAKQLQQLLLAIELIKNSVADETLQKQLDALVFKITSTLQLSFQDALTSSTWKNAKTKQRREYFDFPNTLVFDEEQAFEALEPYEIPTKQACDLTEQPPEPTVMTIPFSSNSKSGHYGLVVVYPIPTQDGKTQCRFIVIGQISAEQSQKLSDAAQSIYTALFGKSLLINALTVNHFSATLPARDLTELKQVVMQHPDNPTMLETYFEGFCKGHQLALDFPSSKFNVSFGGSDSTLPADATFSTSQLAAPLSTSQLPATPSTPDEYLRRLSTTPDRRLSRELAERKRQSAAFEEAAIEANEEDGATIEEQQEIIKSLRKQIGSLKETLSDKEGQLKAANQEFQELQETLDDLRAKLRESDRNSPSASASQDHSVNSSNSADPGTTILAGLLAQKEADLRAEKAKSDNLTAEIEELKRQLRAQMELAQSIQSTTFARSMIGGNPDRTLGVINHSMQLADGHTSFAMGPGLEFAQGASSRPTSEAPSAKEATARHKMTELKDMIFTSLGLCAHLADLAMFAQFLSSQTYTLSDDTHTLSRGIARMLSLTELTAPFKKYLSPEELALLSKLQKEKDQTKRPFLEESYKILQALKIQLERRGTFQNTQDSLKKVNAQAEEFVQQYEKINGILNSEVKIEIGQPEDDQALGTKSGGQSEAEKWKNFEEAEKALEKKHEKLCKDMSVFITNMLKELTTHHTPAIVLSAKTARATLLRNLSIALANTFILAPIFAKFSHDDVEVLSNAFETNKWYNRPEVTDKIARKIKILSKDPDKAKSTGFTMPEKNVIVNLLMEPIQLVESAESTDEPSYIPNEQLVALSKKLYDNPVKFATQATAENTPDSPENSLFDFVTLLPTSAERLAENDPNHSFDMTGDAEIISACKTAQERTKNAKGSEAKGLKKKLENAADFLNQLKNIQIFMTGSATKIAQEIQSTAINHIEDVAQEHNLAVGMVEALFKIEELFLIHFGTTGFPTEVVNFETLGAIKSEILEQDTKWQDTVSKLTSSGESTLILYKLLFDILNETIQEYEDGFYLLKTFCNHLKKLPEKYKAFQEQKASGQTDFFDPTKSNMSFVMVDGEAAKADQETARRQTMPGASQKSSTS